MELSFTNIFILLLLGKIAALFFARQILALLLVFIGTMIEISWKIYPEKG
ncbi:MAG: hypothetical protein UU65_C0003G0120 [candidate division CPR2 bacterium GW2011_GWC1_41_48]|uniref:Uncharacterized protein n=1 Tax=candidate division CPR2 bacterium GW2011_GWC1_41_48 TaxID=1618344 RepID=A0A0G0W7V7_UNCC2|nr:MAG: hypothetical protein UT47_C0003G0126 [candidate division CPR2 bacterium GW2011_GWC2_39_35]KKR28348.1 MAG: hypothetical protein UT60_C0022G0004 [candidate division CPR2 bacterium GW2011_GWD2_39_7]KKR28387.1 MAG: hypothetical protein UT59_C0029G0011 [candidate division CPR2 bacterium GW2011_GWD1_39_7]KKS09065.1 MAG: hypothetical protein UU65_C0003G0120 [candidate division CPR2 bacterium GW2011_GWC1_41_48]